MNECFMAACFAFTIHFELNHVRNRQYSNGIMELQKEKSHATLTLSEEYGTTLKRKDSIL